jgi:hypothetical protein
MIRRAGVSILTALLLAAVSGCGDDEDEANGVTDEDAGTFVGKVSGTDALVAIVIPPAEEGQERSDVTVFVSDAKDLIEWFPGGEVTGESFSAKSEDDDAEAKGELSGEAVTGTIDLPEGETVRYTARRATATAGLYDLSVTSGGDLRGASAAGVALKGDTPLPRPGPGEIKLADGTRLEFVVAPDGAAESAGLRAGDVRLIVLPGGNLSGAGRSRSPAGGGPKYFLIRSSG